MKKLVKLILLCLIAYPIISIVSSCSEEEDCSMNARPMMECYLYTVDRESKRVLNDTLDSLTITAFDTDSVILNNQKRSTFAIIASALYSRFYRIDISL